MRFICLAVLLLCAACALPAAPPSLFQPPVTTLTSPAAEVALIGGSDSLVAGSSRVAVPLGERMAIDGSLFGGYSNAGLDVGVWREFYDKDTAIRIGGTVGTGFSAATGFLNGDSRPITTINPRERMYVGLSGHLQSVKEHPRGKGTMTFLFGGGVTTWGGDEIYVFSPYNNTYIDYSVRVDRNSKVFYGVGVQLVPSAFWSGVILPIYPSVTLGYQF